MFRIYLALIIGPASIKENIFFLFLKMNCLIAFLTIILRFAKETSGQLFQEEIVIGYAWDLGWSIISI